MADDFQALPSGLPADDPPPPRPDRFADVNLRNSGAGLRLFGLMVVGLLALIAVVAIEYFRRNLR